MWTLSIVVATASLVACWGPAPCCRVVRLGATSSADDVVVAAPPAQMTLSLAMDDLADVVGGRGRARSIWDAIRLGIEPLSAESGLTLKTREALARAGIVDKFVPARIEGEPQRAADGTTKLLVRLDDGLAVETVIIPHLRLPRTTLCVSTQVGCDRGCAFCATARMGLIRNLRGDEIAAQFFHAARYVASGVLDCAPLSNVVFMGLGDAGRNAANAALAAAVLTDQAKFGLAKSKVTVSTVGPSPECFHTLSEAPAMLAWSVHSADDSLRKKLVPTHGAYTVLELRDALVDALARRPTVRSRTLMIAATLIAGINDADDDAAELATFVGPLVDVSQKLNVDLIPVNPTDHAPHFRRPSDERLAAFADVVRAVEPRVHVALRIQRGDDKSAACGQLVVHHTREERHAARTWRRTVAKS